MDHPEIWIEKKNEIHTKIKDELCKEYDDDISKEIWDRRYTKNTKTRMMMPLSKKNDMVLTSEEQIFMDHHQNPLYKQIIPLFDYYAIRISQSVVHTYNATIQHKDVVRARLRFKKNVWIGFQIDFVTKDSIL